MTFLEDDNLPVSPAVPQAAPPHVPTAVPPAVCPPSQPPVPQVAPPHVPTAVCPPSQPPIPHATPTTPAIGQSPIARAAVSLVPPPNTATDLRVHQVFPPNLVPLPSMYPQMQHFRGHTAQNLQQGFNIVQSSSTQTNGFRLKWVTGTTVSRCYRCNGEIKNPLESVPDDLVVVYRNIREFRQRVMGQLQYTHGPQNIHFHLRAACIRARYTDFPGATALVVPNDFIPRLCWEHIQRLHAEF